MELTNYGVSGLTLNLNSRSNSDSEEEIPVRPPRRRKKGSKHRSASEPKPADGNTCMNELCSSFTDANHNDKPGISYSRGVCDNVKLSREVSNQRISNFLSSQLSEAESMAAVECKTDSENDSLAQRQTAAIEKIDDVEMAACNQEGIEWTSATDKDELSASDVDSRTLSKEFPFMSSKYGEEKPNFISGSRSETKSSLHAASDSEGESFCSREDEEVPVDTIQEDIITGVSTTNDLESAKCESMIITSGCVLEVEEKVRNSMNTRASPEGEPFHGESKLRKIVPGIIPEGESASGDKQLQDGTIEPGTTPEGESVTCSGDKQPQDGTIEPDSNPARVIASEDKLQNSTIEPGSTPEEESASKDKQQQEDTDTVEPGSTLEGQNDSSDSESSYTSSEGEYDINYAEVFCGVDSTQPLESGNDVIREDDYSTTKCVNTVTEILSVFRHTELPDDDARSEILSVFRHTELADDDARSESQSTISSPESLDISPKDDLQELASSPVSVTATTNINDNVREQNVIAASTISSKDGQENYYFGASDAPFMTTTTNTAECAREGGGVSFVLTAKSNDRDKNKGNVVKVPVGTTSDSTRNTRGGQYFISTSTSSDGDTREQNGTKSDRLSATLKGEAIELRFEELGQPKYRDHALKSPVETIPEETEESDTSRSSSRAGSQDSDSRQDTSGDVVPALQSDLHQANVMRNKTVDKEGDSQALTLTKTKERLLAESSLKGIFSSNAGSPNSHSTTPLTSVSDSSSQSGDVFETYFGIDEVTLSPVKKVKSPQAEVFVTYFGRVIQSSKSEPLLSSERMEENDDKVLRRTESSDLQSTVIHPRTAGFSQKRKEKRIKDEISETTSNKHSSPCNDNPEENAEEIVQTSTNQSKSENTNAKRFCTFYRSLSYSAESPVDVDAKQIDQSDNETPSEFVSYINGDKSNEGAESKLLGGVHPQPSTPSETMQKADSAACHTNKDVLSSPEVSTWTPESKTFDSTVLTTSNSNSSITNRRNTLKKMRSKWGTSYDIEVARQRRLSTEVDEVDIKRIIKYGDDNFPVSGTVENEKKKNTGIESAPLRPPRHKKALKYSQSFATSRSTERRGGNRNKSERRQSSRWRTISSGVDIPTTPDRWRISLLGMAPFTIPLEVANHGPLTLVTDEIPAMFTSFPNDRRAQVVLELYTTERTYVRGLETVIELFKRPIEEYMDTKDIETMFSNIDDIFYLNKDLLFLLCERVTHWTDEQIIGDIFVEMSPKFKIYAKYCNHYDAAESLVKLKAKKRKDFEAFLNACYSDPICQPGLTLQAYMITVVQRLPRYLLLLRDLLKRTPPNHPDYQHLLQAKSKMNGIAEYVNNQLQEFQGQKAMVELRSRLIGIKAFVTPDRCLIKEGEVSLMATKKFYKLLLFNDQLVFVAKGASRQSEVELTMHLETVWFADLADKDPQTTKQDALELYNPERSYTVYCGLRNEKRIWLQKLRTATAMKLHGPEATDEHDIMYRKGGFNYKDGKIYCGAFVDGKRDGQGVLAWPNQTRYQGHWEDDERNGIGELTYNTGDKYNGEWCDDKQHGIGTMMYSNGDFYTGEWFEGQMHGKGMIEFNNKDTFDGQFVRGEIQGAGILNCVSSLRYEGQWQNSKKHGKGKLHFPNGDNYNGDFANDQMHGRGEMIYADQSTYLGQWENDRRHFSGVFSCPNGTTYEGEWNKDLITGRGKMVYPNGDVYSGTWFRNQRFGKGILKYHQGDVYDGQFDYNLRSGKGVMEYRNGGEYVGDWQAGQRSGSGKMIFSDGGVYEGQWSHDLRHGNGKMAFPDGSTYDGSWENDKQHGSGTYSHPESGYFYDGAWQYGKKDGKGVEATSKSKYEGSWKENMRHGKGVETLKSGTVFEGHWKGNRKHGKGFVKLKLGVVEHQMWQDGQLIEKSETVPAELPLLQRRC